jgi:hypothetical protein
MVQLPITTLHRKVLCLATSQLHAERSPWRPHVAGDEWAMSGSLYAQTHATHIPNGLRPEQPIAIPQILHLTRLSLAHSLSLASAIFSVIRYGPASTQRAK